jgi:hypothetical protein
MRSAVAERLVFSYQRGVISRQTIRALLLIGMFAAQCLQRLNAAEPPPNDNFADRIILTGDYVEAGGNNDLASLEPGEPDHAAGLSGSASLWWTWTAPSSGWATITTVESDFPPAFAVYRGPTLATLEQVVFSSEKCAELSPSTVPEPSRGEGFLVQEGETFQLAFASGRSQYDSSGTLIAPYGQIRFSLVVSPLELSSPTNNQTVFTDSSVPIRTRPLAQPGMFHEFSLELDGQTVVLPTLHFARFPDTHWILTNLIVGQHTLRITALDSNDLARPSPPIRIQVRPSNDNFSRAASLSGTNIFISGDAYYASTEPGEPVHPADFDGFTLWYRWTAPEDGIVQMELPMGGGTAVTVYRGDSLTNLQMVVANPKSFFFMQSSPPLYPGLHFAVRAGEPYSIQVSSRSWGPLILHPVRPCDPPAAHPFQLKMQFAPNALGRLDLIPVPGVRLLGFVPLSAFGVTLDRPPAFTDDHMICLFAGSLGRHYSVEKSSDVFTWRRVAEGSASGSMEIVSVQTDLDEPAQFFRVRLSE